MSAAKTSWFTRSTLLLGFAFLYLPMPYPPGLCITALPTGALSAKFTGKELLSYSRGEAVFFDPDESIDAFGLRQLLATVFADDRPFPEKYKTAAALLSMCCVPLDLGSGATLLVSLRTTNYKDSMRQDIKQTRSPVRSCRRHLPPPTNPK